MRSTLITFAVLIFSTIAAEVSRPDEPVRPGPVAVQVAPADQAAPADPMALLDAPLLFVKRHAYMSAHIYDDYYEWKPGGGIYVLENPADPPEKQRVRAVIDPTTPVTLGVGVYRDPELSYDAKKVVFAYKGSRDGDTSIYEIHLDGTNLRRLTDPSKAGTKVCSRPPPQGALGKGRHDISPCYLPDGRIVFTSTRNGNRVPCFNSEVDTLHVMDADGSNVRPISVNNVNEFDPVVLPDGRILYGRWEYVDKTALYIQSLWTINPDGTGETALFKNNLCRPTAVLDARPVPGTHLVAASLTPHNGQSVGAIVTIDPHLGKNNLAAITNFTPEYPTEMDQGLTRGPCDPWPLSRDAILVANNARGHAVIELIERNGRRRVIRAEPDIGCYSPMLVKPRPVPPVVPGVRDEAAPAAFLVQDVYQGLPGVKRGEVAALRVIEETARISGIPDGGRWWNQAFLVSWQGAYTVKNVLGVVPVHADGSARFEAPAGRALYFQALDRDGRMVQSMRTFVAAVPGTTRACVGCHEYKHGAPPEGRPMPSALASPPAKLRDEAWGSGYIDFAGQVQPVLDRHCVSCHGGPGGIDGGIDLSGSWTWAFSIAYETLIGHTLVGFLNCENGRERTAEVLPPRAHGSGQAPLAALLMGDHGGRVKSMTEAERSLLLAWMDLNASYYGTWDWSEHATVEAIRGAGAELAGLMRQAGCTKCHAAEVGHDWVNLKDPELSRILRAPMKAGVAGGLAWCRDRKATRVLGLVDQRHQPPDIFTPRPYVRPDRSGEPVISFASVEDERYRAMLSAIRRARREALGRPRVDMPGADVRPGEIRQIVATPLPQRAMPLDAQVRPDGSVELAWERSARTIGLEFEVHRGAAPGFAPTAATRLATTPGFRWVDGEAPAGEAHYALVPVSDDRRGPASARSVRVPAPAAPPTPAQLAATPEPAAVRIEWDAPAELGLAFHVERAAGADGPWRRLTERPLRAMAWTDASAEPGTAYRYRVTPVSRRGGEGRPAETAAPVAPLPLPKEPVFTAALAKDLAGSAGADALVGRKHGAAQVAGGALDLARGGHATFAKRPAFDLAPQFSVQCRVLLEPGSGSMPVVLSCGHFNRQGWFVQAFQGRWRFYAGGSVCDGGRVTPGKWAHVLATYDGRSLRLYVDGKRVAETPAAAVNREPWDGPLVVGQYSAPAPEFQVIGKVADVAIYHRAIAPESP